MCLIACVAQQPDHLKQQQLTGGAGNPLPSSAMVLTCQLQTDSGWEGCLQAFCFCCLLLLCLFCSLSSLLPTTHESVADTLRWDHTPKPVRVVQHRRGSLARQCDTHPASSHARHHGVPAANSTHSSCCAALSAAGAAPSCTCSVLGGADWAPVMRPATLLTRNRAACSPIGRDGSS